jgi:DNA-binding NarL/FixJ family response regulator
MHALIEEQPDMHVVAEAITGEEAVDLARELCPEIIVMDILMPGMNGVEATRAICAAQPGLKVLALSNHFGASLVQAILDAGGQGYVQKSRAFEELIPALRSVAAGKQYVCQRFPDPTP